MSKFKPGLGRGLDALISPNLQNNDSNLTISSKEIKIDDGESFDVLIKAPIGSIVPNPYQPRTNFDPEAHEELKKSILENGLIQPITIRRLTRDKYELISGERRLRACREIGYKEIPAYIIKVETKEAMLALALIENIQREKLNSIEIAQAYKRLMDECNLSQEEIAVKVGKDRTTITNSIRLLKLPLQVQDCLIKDKISMGHARALINLPGEELQIEVLNKIITDSLSVRKLEALVKKYLTESPQVRKKVTDSSITKSAATAHSDFEDKLRRIFGTKVICKQKNDGTGEIIIEFYSNDELERLFEMFEIIGKSYS